VLFFVKLLDSITLFTLVLLRPLGGVIFVVLLLLLCFPFVPLRQKGGVIFDLDRDCIFWTGIVFLTGQVIFVPEWPKGEFVRL
jgi:predicted membrane channel-forming protein YqfA (hemolysin III family)